MNRESSHTVSDLAYAAGVIDSDGYIGVHRSDYAKRVRGDATQAVYQPRVQVKQVTPEAIDLLHEMFGGHRYTGSPTAMRGRPLFVWSVHSASCERVLTPVLPYLRIKREQAVNALRVCEVNRGTLRRRFEVPPVVEGEQLVPLAVAAERVGRSYATAYQSVRLGNIPYVRVGRRVFVPESYLETWRTRRRSPARRADITDELERRFLLAKSLNRVGVRE